MLNDLSELEGLVEEDMLEALGEPVSEEKQKSSEKNIEEDDIVLEDVDVSTSLNEEDIIFEDYNENKKESSSEDEIKIEDFEDIQTDNLSEELDELLEENNIVDTEDVSQNDDARVSTIKTDDLATLLSQLLNNKTIEITIKIKD